MKRSRVIVLVAAAALAIASARAIRAGDAPPKGVTRFIAGGDSSDDLYGVLPWAFDEARARGASAFFFIGDMELDAKLEPSIAPHLAKLGAVPFFPVLGNHEARVAALFVEAKTKAKVDEETAQDELRETFVKKTRAPAKAAAGIGRKIVYSVDLDGGVHFIALDNVTDDRFGEKQLAWLEEDLKRARANPATRHVFVGMHKPLAESGSAKSMDKDARKHADDKEDAKKAAAEVAAESRRAVELFDEHGVDLILMSHKHELLECEIKGPKRAMKGWITGGLGAALTKKADAGATLCHHFLVIDVAEKDVSVSVVKWTGKESRKGPGARDEGDD